MTSVRKLTPAEARAMSDETIISAYEETGNIWKAAEALGMLGQTVWARLKRAGHPVGNPYTDEDRAVIRDYYHNTPIKDFDLNDLSERLGRPKQSVCVIARQMGLTNQSRPAGEKSKQALREARRDFWAERGHPRGALGMKHSDENKKLFSKLSKANWKKFKRTKTGPMSETSLQLKSDRMSKRMAYADPSKIYSRGAAGYREDLGDIYFRSRWEANYARYLNWLLARNEIQAWQYEPETFWFDAIKRGVRSYKPDFKITEKGKTYFVEIKGYMDAKSKTKIKRMRIYHPTVELRLVAQKEYYSIAKVMAPIIPLWETEVKGKSVTRS